MTPEQSIIGRRGEDDESFSMTPERRMGRARNRLRQALHNMDDNEFDSACNRAYYAAFEAAKAALAALGVPEPKTHRGLNNQFHHHVVSTGLIDEDTGASLSKIEDKRLLADYVEDVIPEDKAREAVDMAEEFVEAIESKLALIIANKKERQEIAHQREPGWKKGHIKQVGWRTTYDAALEWKEEQAKMGKPVVMR